MYALHHIIPNSNKSKIRQRYPGGNYLPKQNSDVMTPFDDPQAELAWMCLHCLCKCSDLDQGFALLNGNSNLLKNRHP